MCSWLRVWNGLPKGKFPALNYMSYDGMWKVELQLHQFLTSALDGGGWSASCPGHLTPVE